METKHVSSFVVLASNTAGVNMDLDARHEILLARRDAWIKRRQEDQPLLPVPQPPPPPPTAAPPRRLVSVVREKASCRSSYCQLDGEAGEKPTELTPPSPPTPSPPATSPPHVKSNGKGSSSSARRPNSQSMGWPWHNAFVNALLTVFFSILNVVIWKYMSSLDRIKFWKKKITHASQI